MSYNIRHGRGTDGKTDLNRIVQILAAHQADIIALQEVDWRLPRSCFKKQAAILAAELDMHYAYGPALKIGHFSYYGNAILSRFPIMNTATFPIKDPWEKRSLMAADVDLGGGAVLKVFNTHLGLHPASREEQVRERLLPHLQACIGPAILCGDLNEEKEGPALGLINEFMCDTASLSLQVLPNIATFPSEKPEKQIDYIFFKGNMMVSGLQVIPALASDHLPIIAELETL